MGKLQPYTKEWLEELCAESYSLSEVLKKAGRKGGGSQAILKKKIEEFNIDISHFTGQRWWEAPDKVSNFAKGQKDYSKEKYQLEEIFKKDSPVTQKVMRGYIQRHNLLEYKCENCGCDGHWQNGIIALDLHHKDGDNTNNELDNLCFLCPNCHALTDNYRGKNKSKEE